MVSLIPFPTVAGRPIHSPRAASTHFQSSGRPWRLVDSLVEMAWKDRRFDPDQGHQLSSSPLVSIVFNPEPVALAAALTIPSSSWEEAQPLESWPADRPMPVLLQAR